MSADPLPTEGESIESAIYEVSRSIDSLVELLSEKLGPKHETERVFIDDVPPNRSWGTISICYGTMQKLDPAYRWKIFAERVK